MPSSVARDLRALRTKMGLTQSQMGERLGISQAYVAQIETEAVNASPRIAEKIYVMSGKPVRAVQTTSFGGTEVRGRFGDWLQEQRTKLGLSRQQLADKAGISYFALYFIEIGETQSPRESTVNALKKALGAELPKDVKTELVESKEGGFGDWHGEFSIDNWEKEVPRGTPGIYVFYDISKRPVYIGESGDIKDRIGDHEEKFWFKSPMVHTISYLEVKDQKVRARLEAAMIKVVGINAIFNTQHKIKPE